MEGVESALADEKSSVVHNYRDFAAQVSLSPSLYECNDLSLLTVTFEESSTQYRGTLEISSHVSPRVAQDWFPAKREKTRRTATKWIVTATFAAR
jgi:hypothetical protein